MIISKSCLIPGYIELNDPAEPKYFCGYTGYVYITSSGYMALNDYEYQTRLSNSIAELRCIADTAKEQASAARQQAQAANEKLQIAKEQVGMAKLDAKWSKTFGNSFYCYFSILSCHCFRRICIYSPHLTFPSQGRLFYSLTLPALIAVKA